MYHNASISPLSSTQISKILNGHSVRVPAGNGHDVELSKEQFKKLSKAHNAGKAITLTMNPFQMYQALTRATDEKLSTLMGKMCSLLPINNRVHK